MNGTELKNLRIKHNLTQKDVADAISAKQPRIAEWENGKYNISNAYQILLNQFFSNIQK
jgi:transcriptional regulator with XRE-family HTH domain